MELQTYLDERGLSQREFAKIAGVSYVTISRICRGFEPSLAIAVKIEKATKGKVKPKDLPHAP